MNNLHPTPQFRRDKWLSLDGKWDFAFDNEKKGDKEKWFHTFPKGSLIEVPFTYETKLSGIHQEEHHETVWYERIVEIDDLEKHPIVHFEGVDYEAFVYVNGNLATKHRGGYHAFSVDIAKFVHVGENKLTVKVTDSKDCSQPRGKQRWQDENFGCWYVQTTGIWKSVWMEYVSPMNIEHAKITPLYDEQEILIELDTNIPIEADGYRVEATINFDGKLINSLSAILIDGSACLRGSVLERKDPWTMKTWSPENPHLYDLHILLYKENQLLDEVHSYFGMRKISIDGNRILLNNRELYQRLILDQGYWQDSDLTPPSVEALEEDIKKVLELGYNGVRKHQKVEDSRFLYLADKYGLLVWLEVGSTYAFNDRAVKNFTHEWLEIVKQSYNHPSVITWVPFNESWGVSAIHHNKKQQAFTESIYYLTKTYDQMRPVITNDGWEHTISDIITLHDYEEFGKLFTERYKEMDYVLSNRKQFNKDFYPFAENYSYKGQPIIISEFGGIAFQTEEGWGYGNQVKDEEAFFKRFEDIHYAIQDLDYVVGYCYTQLTDVQQEVNGLLTIDRKPKVSMDRVKKINTRRMKP
ncbi:glycoside hydrolase family 2 protein [Bacillus sp. B1-b2]|uniref:glycoside hydrolase family 2 protein n=1 Tax=Bacillus sp. B1-b2 TaxID=2653201 RepID=UPI001261852E|nr:sugar-binding domain-containing protein [Bacillus sp. B1-b2]KAB7669218.1 glycoside hydrolase family 2 [Bacillus sp. B1-b2]